MPHAEHRMPHDSNQGTQEEEGEDPDDTAARVRYEATLPTYDPSADYLSVVLQVRGSVVDATHRRSV